MTPTQWFPSLLILLDLAAALVYGLDGHWRMVGYWLFAAGLTACVTY